MQAGKLRHRVTLQRLTGDRGPAGGVNDAWADIGIRWASVRPLTGREWTAAAAANTQVSHDVMLRHDSLTTTLTPRDRLIFESRIFDIQAAIDVEERGREIRLMCVERP